MSSSKNSHSTGIKNRAPAAIQISSEQILREAADRQQAHVAEPILKIHDAEEYQAHLRDRRKHFEDNIRYRREHIGNWVKYARLEEDNREFERARSIFERALEVDHRSAELWLRYAELELRNQFVNHARNVLDRAVQILPRVDFLWYKYVYLEEMVGDVPKCRAVFERWMHWQPDDNAWLSFARFETRHGGSPERAEAVLRRYVNVYPTARAFLRFAKWAEYEAHNVPLARTLYEATLSELEPEEAKQARVFAQFAAFEERQGETDRARVIYQHAVELLHLEDKSKQQQQAADEDLSEYEVAKRDELYKVYITFEKKHGHREGIESLVLTKQRAQYKQRLEANPMDHDGWLEWAQLEEAHGQTDAARHVYEQAVANVPESDKIKKEWRRYIYIWIYYACFEELVNGDLDRASQVYETCLSLIPHRHFSFAKVWVYAAKLHVRRRDLGAARQLLGRALGVCGKESIYKEYIALELALGEVDRCRTLYNNYVKAYASSATAWLQYAQLEKAVGETERCRALYELAVSQPALDRPELLWKHYIDLEQDEGEAARARALYERLLSKTQHVKVWISYAQMEGSTPLGQGMDAARQVLERAEDHFKGLSNDDNVAEDRVLLLDEWRALEQAHGTAEQVAAVEAKMPRRIKRKRQDDGGGWEEYFDYQFPADDGQTEDAGNAGNFKLLEMAAQWKAAQKANAADEDSDSDDDD